MTTRILDRLSALIGLWDSAYRNARDRQQMVAALREGLDDIRAGRTKPARTALKALAKKYGIVPDEK